MPARGRLPRFLLVTSILTLTFALALAEVAAAATRPSDALAVSPSPINFGTATAGSGIGTITVTLTNTTNETMRFGGIGFPAPPFGGTTEGTCWEDPELSPNESCTVVLSFDTNTAPGRYRGNYFFQYCTTDCDNPSLKKVLALARVVAPPGT